MTANVLRPDGYTVTVQIEELRGYVVVVKLGERILVDGVVMSGSAAVASIRELRA